MKPVRRVIASVLSVVTLTSCSAGKPTESPVAGAASIGDPYTPGDGNGGYDVRHYDLDLRVTPGPRPAVAGTVTIIADAARPLSRFNLDLTGLSVSAVSVNGARTAFARTPGELIVIPGRPLPRGAFSVAVTYSGTPNQIKDPVLGDYGWMPTHDGVFTGDEPSGAHTWFPCNDHPSDKASFGFKITVPKGLTAVANGEPTGQSTIGGLSTYTWREQAPMATYLAMVDVGRFTVRTGATPAGIPMYVAVDDSTSAPTPAFVFDHTGTITDTWAKTFGPFPFASTGGVVDNASAQFALETQTKPEYVPSMATLPTTLAHELAHQWFGDSVSVERWSDIWLNEGFATYAEWMWGEREPGGISVRRQFDTRYADTEDTALWSVAPAAPGRAQLFGRAVYERGAMTLQVLRMRVGDTAFFAILRAWAAAHRHGNATTAQFAALAEKVSGRNLQRLFQVWLYGRQRPTSW